MYVVKHEILPEQFLYTVESVQDDDHDSVVRTFGTPLPSGVRNKWQGEYIAHVLLM